ncbi:hypothetical protein [Sphingomonas sp.]|uniref:hypothetical protein n=1 Tax=Sphingomonas sp. TaxID=28214 RepID=UPI002CD4C041|nr:hypothetical protein [Sphingomonas sp.]HWK36931.1 hypothetical protein [Sphingomonas sp.]
MPISPRMALAGAAVAAALTAGTAAAQTAPALPNPASIVSVDAGSFHTGHSPTGPATAINLGQTSKREGVLATVDALTGGPLVNVAVNSLTKAGTTQLADVATVTAGGASVTAPNDGNAVVGVNVAGSDPGITRQVGVNVLTGGNVVDVTVGALGVAVPTWTGIPGLSNLPLKITLPKPFGK